MGRLKWRIKENPTRHRIWKSNYIFLFVAVSHGDKLDFSVYRRDSWRRTKFFCLSSWLTVANWIFLLSAMSHGDKLDFSVCRLDSWRLTRFSVRRHDSRRRTGFSYSSPWLMATNWIFLFVAMTHGDKLNFPVCRHDSRRRTGFSCLAPWIKARIRENVK